MTGRLRSDVDFVSPVPPTPRRDKTNPAPLSGSSSITQGSIYDKSPETWRAIPDRSELICRCCIYTCPREQDSEARREVSEANELPHGIGYICKLRSIYITPNSVQKKGPKVQ